VHVQFVHYFHLEKSVVVVALYHLIFFLEQYAGLPVHHLIIDFGHLDGWVA
jgi:hypothetical protein